MPYIDNLPSKAEIFDHWKSRFEEIGLFCDWGEPSCWACGFHYDDRYDLKKPAPSMKEICALWEKPGFQRCHIVPRSLGGADAVDNLFLMCRECHDLAPDTDEPEVFFRWARSQSCLRREYARMSVAMADFGVDTEADQEIVARLLRSAEFKTWAKGKTGFHRPQSNYAHRSARLKFATVIGLAIEFRRKFPDTAEMIAGLEPSFSEAITSVPPS